MNSLRLFGMNASLDFAKEVADHLDVELTKHHEKYFSDREPYVHSEDNVRGCDVYVIQSLYTDENESVNDKFTKLLFFIGSLKDASAQRVTAIIPYLSFGRQDRKTESRAPRPESALCFHVTQIRVQVGQGFFQKLMDRAVRTACAFREIRIPLRYKDRER